MSTELMMHVTVNTDLLVGRLENSRVVYVDPAGYDDCVVRGYNLMATSATEGHPFTKRMLLVELP